MLYIICTYKFEAWPVTGLISKRYQTSSWLRSDIWQIMHGSGCIILGRAPACKGAYGVVRLTNFIRPGRFPSDQWSVWEVAWCTIGLFLSPTVLSPLSLSISLSRSFSLSFFLSTLTYHLIRSELIAGFGFWVETFILFTNFRFQMFHGGIEEYKKSMK